MKKEYFMNIAEIVNSSEIYGPGNRFVIWVQGCSLRCKGCWNSEMHSKEPNKKMSVESIFKRIQETENIEGITILGGEPLQQAEPILSLARKAKGWGLTIMLYTGYEMKEIRNKAAKELLDLSDIIIMGRYIHEKRSINLKWRGSTNQQIIFNNIKYEKKFENEIEENQAEIHISDDGEITVIGYPDEELRRAVLN